MALKEEIAVAGTAMVMLFITNFLAPLIQIWTCLNLTFGWMKWGFVNAPIIKRIPATHRERASERVDAKITIQTKLAILGTALAVYLFLKPHEIFFRSRTEPAYSTDQDKTLETTIEFTKQFAMACIFLQVICQVVLNYRLRTYAGTYRLIGILSVVKGWLDELSTEPMVVGKYEPLPGTSLSKGLMMVLGLVEAWQAVVFPGVLQVDPAEYDE